MTINAQATREPLQRVCTSSLENTVVSTVGGKGNVTLWLQYRSRLGKLVVHLTPEAALALAQRLTQSAELALGKPIVINTKGVRK